MNESLIGIGMGFVASSLILISLNESNFAYPIIIGLLLMILGWFT